MLPLPDTFGPHLALYCACFCIPTVSVPMKLQTILIVDDNSQMRRTLRDLLSDVASAYYECSDGHGALAAYQQYRPDWVLMDLKMAEVDGLPATAAIYAADPAARIVIVTNYDDPALREAARLAGACGFVPKENLLELRALISPTS
jgi:DNA-binding NarL/FixJ family response regulator